jgi:hypothetical protein
MTEQTAIGQIVDAREVTRQALELWDATDMSRICQCQELIGRASSGLASVNDSGVSSIAASMRLEIMRLREDAGRLIRLVDASSAFQRGLRLCSGSTEPEYGVSGRVIHNGNIPVPSGLEG